MPEFHADELPIDHALVRRLVDRAFPQYATLGLAALPATGSSNVLFRLGDHLVVRLPRQPGGGATIDKEARWLPVVSRHTTIEVPDVVGTGEPDLGYSERWSITRWIDGTPVVAVPRAAPRDGLALDLARFLRELRAIEVPAEATSDETLTWYRGQRLADLDADFRETVDGCRSLDVGLDLDQVLRVWDRAAEASLAAAPISTWYHGDLLAENLLLNGDRLAAVLDFGGLAIGNPTVDLVVAWELLDADGRRELRRALDVDDATWTASRGWALLIALITFPYYGATMPRRCADRLAMARSAMAAH